MERDRAGGRRRRLRRRRGTARRADAQRPKLAGRKAEAAVNDGLILQAARDVLTTAPDTPMAEIAARAGVGVGSLTAAFRARRRSPIACASTG